VLRWFKKRCCCGKKAAAEGAVCPVVGLETRDQVADKGDEADEHEVMEHTLPAGAERITEWQGRASEELENALTLPNTTPAKRVSGRQTPPTYEEGSRTLAMPGGALIHNMSKRNMPTSARKGSDAERDSALLSTDISTPTLKPARQPLSIAQLDQNDQRTLPTVSLKRGVAGRRTPPTSEDANDIGSRTLNQNDQRTLPTVSLTKGVAGRRTPPTSEDANDKGSRTRATPLLMSGGAVVQNTSKRTIRNGKVAKPLPTLKLATKKRKEKVAVQVVKPS
jgi:hypothetical protein